MDESVESITKRIKNKRSNLVNDSKKDKVPNNVGKFFSKVLIAIIYSSYGGL